MRTAAVLVLTSCLAALGGCAPAEDGDLANDSSEINDARGTLERELDPPIAVPESEAIGAKLADVLVKAKGTATAGSPRKVSDDCKQTDFKSGKTTVAAHVVCSGSEIVRTLDAKGAVEEEHFDLNKDGKVDRFATTKGALVTVGDGDYDGKVDLVIERVDRLEEFSMKGYEETYPRTSFLHRVREDRDNDGKLDHEKLTAKGVLPPKKSGS